MGQDRLLANTIIEEGQSDFINNLGAYTCGIDDKLWLCRELVDANSYFPYVFGWPFGNTDPHLTFAARENKAGSIQVPPGSYLWGLTGYSINLSAPDLSNAKMFSLSVVDKGSGMGITERDLTFSGGYTGAGRGFPSMPGGPFLLTAPFIVTRPGQIAIKITNLAEQGAIIQIALHFAVPLNDRSLNTPQIRQV